MALNKPNQQLRRDLKDAANTLDDLAHEMFSEAQQRGDTELVNALERIEGLHKTIDALRGYADEVLDGRIVRAKV